MGMFSEKLEQKKAEDQAKSAALDTLIDVIIECAPEEAAIDFEILKAHKEIHLLSTGLVEEVTLKSSDSEEYPLEAKKEVLEYLTMVAEGIKLYTECVKEQLKNSKTELN